MSVAAAKKKRPSAKPPGKRTRPGKAAREEWLRRLRAEYTQQVCIQTLTLNESLPVDGES